MKKITDERLIIRNLKNIRVAFIVQTLGILFILGYELLTSGMEGMRDNPIWFVFILTSVVYSYLSMSVSIDHEKAIKNPKKSFVTSVVVLSLLAVTITYLVSITPDYDMGDGALLGAIFWICGIVPFFYIYKLREKKFKDMEIND